MTDISSDLSKVTRLGFFSLALITASFACGPISVLASLLLVDIGNTFHTPIGVTGQINTAYSVASFTLALLMSFLSVRFGHKSLLLGGVLLMIASTLGCFLASDFASLLAFYSVSGAGYAMVNPMLFALVGHHFPLERRPSAIGWIVGGRALVYVIGTPVIALMSGLGGWRFPLLGFVLPVLLVSVLTASLGIPSGSKRSLADTKTRLSYREIFANRSAVACLIGDAFRSAAFIAIVLYAASFFRQHFSMALGLASFVMLGAAVTYLLGSQCASSLVRRFGRKPSAVLTALLSGTLTILYVLAPTVMLSSVLMLIAAWFFGMAATSANSLTLEQVPRLRGAMMSLDTAVFDLGSGFGTVAGGLALLYLGYQGMGSALGALGIVAALILSLMAIDPTKLQQHSQRGFTSTDMIDLSTIC